MVRSMAKNPIVFAMANPDPEITYPDAKAARTDVIMATGRSDYPNQVNNVLGLPLHLPRRPRRARHGHQRRDEDGAPAAPSPPWRRSRCPRTSPRPTAARSSSSGPSTSSPSPSTRASCVWEASAVAKAACDTGVAKQPITDWDGYRAKPRGHDQQEPGGHAHHRRPRPGRRPSAWSSPRARTRRWSRRPGVLVEDGLAKPILLGDPDGHRVQGQARRAST